MFYKSIFAAAALLLSCTAVHASPNETHVLGHVSVSGASTLANAEQMLADKAHKMGGSDYRVISMAWKNKVTTTAVVLK